jgi:hypothetical protein
MTSALPTPEDDGDRTLLADVENHGWHVVNVAQDDATPGWCFTVGLQHTYGHPEVVIFGLPPDTAHALLNIAGEAVKSGRAFETDVGYDDFIEGFDCIFRPVHGTWHKSFMGYACWFYRGAGFNAHQLFWPNRHGALPWQEGADGWLRSNQPRLSLADKEEAGVIALLASMEGI